MTSNDKRKVAIITGASQGIGADLTRGFLERGYRVVATSRSIKDAGNKDIVTVAGDIADRRTATAVVSAALGTFGRIDTLINNAGIFIPKPFTAYTDEDFDAFMGTNVRGAFYMTQLAAAPMLAQGSGHIVNVTTSLVNQPMAAVPAGLASLSKGGLDALTRSLAIEFAGRGVRVNAVSPGIIKTPMHQPESHAALATLHPLGRMGETKEITEAILYLESAEFVTGETLHVDGGTHAGRW